MRERERERERFLVNIFFLSIFFTREESGVLIFLHQLWTSLHGILMMKY